jgi:hypothetical protein
MKVLTIATDLDNTFLNRLLVPSCNSAGLDLVILHSTKQDFRPRDKRLILTNYLTQHAAADDLIVFTDAYDTMFIRGEQYIREAYTASPRAWCSAPNRTAGHSARSCSPSRKVHPSGPYPYLNSGGFIGPADDILALCTKYPEPPNDQFQLLQKLQAHGFDTNERFTYSDQNYWTLVHLLETETVGLDNSATLFEYFGPSVADVWDFEISRGDIRFPGPRQSRHKLSTGASQATGATAVTKRRRSSTFRHPHDKGGGTGPA